MARLIEAQKEEIMQRPALPEEKQWQKEAPLAELDNTAIKAPAQQKARHPSAHSFFYSWESEHAPIFASEISKLAASMKKISRVSRVGMLVSKILPQKK